MLVSSVIHLVVSVVHHSRSFTLFLCEITVTDHYHETIVGWRPESCLTMSVFSLFGCSRRSRLTGRWHRWSRTQGWWRRWSSCTDWCTELLVSCPPATSWTETQRHLNIHPHCKHQLHLHSLVEIQPFISDAMGLFLTFNQGTSPWKLHCTANLLWSRSSSDYQIEN